MMHQNYEVEVDPTPSRKRRTHCSRGHAWNKENTRVRADGTGRACRACAREHQREYRDRDDPSVALRRERRQAGCPQGHAWTAENTRADPRTGKWHCRACDRERSRRRYAEAKKAAN